MALMNAKGRIVMLRAHEVGSKFGSATDSLDVEVVVKLDSKPDLAFGFQLRSDANQIAHHGMFDLLRDAFNRGWTTSIDYEIAAKRKNGTILRVWLTRDGANVAPAVTVGPTSQVVAKKRARKAT